MAKRAFTADMMRTPQPLPLVAITGTRGKSTTAWLLYKMLRARSLSSALWSSSGVYVNDHRLPGELQPWSTVVRALAAGELDAAIQELEAPVVASVGLPEGVYALGAATMKRAWLLPRAAMRSGRRRSLHALCIQTAFSF